MSASFVIVCVATQAISEAFTDQLSKKLTDLPLILTKTKKNIQNHQYFVTINSGFEEIQESLIDISKLHQVDIGLIPQKIFESKKGLVVFDMDSTLITAEVIDEMALRHGVGTEVKAITVRAMNGNLNFDQSLTERVALLKGFHRRHMQDILNELVFTPGVPEFIKVLKSLGIKTAIASGGFEFFAKNIQSQLKMDYVFANTLEFENDLLTGRVTGSIVNAEAKERIIQQLASENNLTLEQVVAIGDGANDIPMLLKAGLGIAIHAKEKVQNTARYRINFGPMTHALSYMNHETL